MATELHSIKLKELSLVKRGANQGARVVLVKHDTTERLKMKSEKQIATALAALVEKQLDGDGEPLTDFATNLTAAEEKIGKACDNLVEEITKIGMNEKADDDQKASLVGASIGQFLSTIKEKHPDAESSLQKLLTENSLTKEFFTTRSRKNGDDDMPGQKEFDELEKKNVELQKGLDAATAAIEELKKASMPADHQAYMNGLKNPDDKKKFMQMSPEDRAAQMKKAADEIAKNEEEFKMGDLTIKKSAVGAEVFSVLKGLHGTIAGQAAEISKLNDEKNETMLVTKMKAEYPHVPGEALAKARLLAALEKLAPENKKTMQDIMKAANEAISKNLSEIGGTGGSNSDSAEAELNALAKEYQTKNSGMTFAKAYEETLTNHPELYAKYEKEKAARTRAG